MPELNGDVSEYFDPTCRNQPIDSMGEEIQEVLTGGFALKFDNFTFKRNESVTEEEPIAKD